MNLLKSSLTKKLLGGLATVVISGLTIFSTGAAVIKVASSVDHVSARVPEVKAAETVEANADQESPKAEVESGQNSVSTIPTRPAATPTPKTTPSILAARTTLQTTISPTPTPKPNTTSLGCIITLFGKQYDVSPLQTTHTGGNIFNCGTDMTAVYQGQHGTDVTRMQPYLVSTGNPGNPIPTPTPGNTNTGGTSVSPTTDRENEKDDTEKESDREGIKKAVETAVHESED